MIVCCEKCKSKFKVDDARIPDAGVMASCSVCSHRFHLKKEPQVVEVPSASEVEEAARPAKAPEPAKKSPLETFSALFQEPAVPTDQSTMAEAHVAAPAVATTTKPPATAFEPSRSADHGNDRLPTASAFEIVAEGANQEDSLEVATVVDAIEAFDDDVFSSDPADAQTDQAYKAFEDFLNRQMTEDTAPDQVRRAAATHEAPAAKTAAVDGKLAGGSAAAWGDMRAERVEAKPAVATATGSVARHAVPEIVADGQGGSLQRAVQKPFPAIISMLHERGLTDEYVVTKVQEVCEATRFVEGVEKPDWGTRILGLDLLCKIKGLYGDDRKEEPTNRQFQIVTGINM